MKKIYSQLEVEVLLLAEDIVSTSNTYTYGQDFEPGTNADSWWGN